MVSALEESQGGRAEFVLVRVGQAAGRTGIEEQLGMLDKFARCQRARRFT